MWSAVLGWVYDVPVSRRPQPFDAAAQERFLSALAKGLSVKAAVEAAGVGRRTPYSLRERDPEFARAWESAFEAGTDAYEDEARRRALEGVPEPITFKGEVTGTVQRYSDRLLELVLKARRPEKYRERHEHIVSSAPLSQEQLAAARAQGMDPDVEEAAATLAALPVLPENPPAGG